MEFWEMVCQDQIQQIIMLTNLTEQGQVSHFEIKKKIMSKIYEIKFYNIKKQAEVIMYIYFF